MLLWENHNFKLLEVYRGFDLKDYKDVVDSSLRIEDILPGRAGTF